MSLQDVRDKHIQLLEDEISSKERKLATMRSKSSLIVDKFSLEQQQRIMDILIRSEQHIDELKDCLTKLKHS